MLITTQIALQNSAQRFGSKEAIRVDRAALSYEGLNRAANKIARQLGDIGIQRGERVGIFLEKSIDAVSSVYGILKAGGAYVPLDCNSPLNRNSYIIRDCGIEVVIIAKNELEKVLRIFEKTGSPKTALMLSPGRTDSTGGLKIVTFESIMQQSDADILNTNTVSDDAAAILYTSGTTGLPKGAVITHGNISAFIKWVAEEFEISEQDAFVSHAPLHFDLSLLDIHSSLARGATVILVPHQKSMNPQYLVTLIEEQKITIWQSVPSVLALIAEYGDCQRYAFEHLRHILFAGERFSLKYLKKLKTCFKNATFYNIYGCTETNDTFIYKVPDREEIDPLPIGKPLPYVEYAICDETGKDVPTGTEGELLVRAPTVMKGYWGGKEETLGSFVIHTVGEKSGKTYYRTKDIVKILPDGNLHLSGRTDNIVKSSGYRINLLEIEKHLMAIPEIKEAAVIPVKDEIIGNKICAIISTERDVVLSKKNVKLYCADKMPKYMIPHIIEITNTKLPKTSSGKIDKQYQVNKFSNEIPVTRHTDS